MRAWQVDGGKPLQVLAAFEPLSVPKDYLRQVKPGLAWFELTPDGLLRPVDGVSMNAEDVTRVRGRPRGGCERTVVTRRPRSSTARQTSLAGQAMLVSG